MKLLDKPNRITVLSVFIFFITVDLLVNMYIIFNVFICGIMIQTH